MVMLEWQISLEVLTGKPLDLSHMSKRCFRFIDVDAFLNDNRLQIVSFASLTERKYATISYPWHNLQADVSSKLSPDSLGYITMVSGAEEGGLISFDVLRTCCRALKQLGDPPCRLLWLDRISIIQTDSEDKAWQIRHMNDIYKNCEMCFVLPGGIQRLAKLDESTTWLKRMWTLQEALVPSRVDVLFRWDAGGKVKPQEGSVSPLPLVEEDGSSYMNLYWMLQAAMTGFWYKLEGHEGEPFTKERAMIFDRTEAGVLIDLMQAHSPETKEAGVWKCAWMRTSSRPVDMVLSIMGLFGVELDPIEFGDNDRETATLAFSKSIRQKVWVENTQSWVKSSRPVVQTNSNRSLATKLQRIVPSSQQSSQDKRGYILICSKAKEIRKATKDEIGMNTLKSTNSECWVLLDEQWQTNEGEYYAVVIKESPELSTRKQEPTVLAILQHSAQSSVDNDERFDLRIYSHVQPETVKFWTTREFKVSSSRALMS